MAELVAFTRKTAMMLFSPPLHKFPVPFVHKVRRLLSLHSAVFAAHLMYSVGPQLVIHLVVVEVRLTGADGVAAVQPEAYDAVTGSGPVAGPSVASTAGERRMRTCTPAVPSGVGFGLR